MADETQVYRGTPDAGSRDVAARVPALFKRVTIWIALVAGGLGFALALWFATDWHSRLLDAPALATPWQVITLFFVTAFAPLLPIWRRLSDRLLAATFVFLGTSLGFALGIAYGPSVF